MANLRLPKLKLDDISFKNKTIINQSSIRNLSNNLPIEIFPSEVYFRQIQTNNTYELAIQVKNLTKKARRIRVFQPKSTKFRCDYDIKGSIAPGLSIKLTLSFQTQTIGDFQDELKIISEDNFTQIIPIYAIQEQAEILFEPFLNLGFVKVGQKKIDNIYFKNEGTTAGQVDLKFEPQRELKIEPVSFVVEPQQILPIKIEFDSDEAGIFKSQIDVQLEGFYNFQKQIEINATSVEFSRFFIDQNGQQIGFFDMYFGNKHRIKGYLVNNTPQTIQFKQKIRIGAASLIKDSKNLNSLQTPKELGEEQTMNIIQCQPQSGIIESYSQIPVTFCCESKITENTMKQTIQNAIMPQLNLRNFEEDFEYCSIIEIENDQPLIMNIIGKCIRPDLNLSQSVFNFGECPVNDVRDIQFTIKNQGDLPLNVKMEKNFYFSINPSITSIESNQEQIFLASFNPKSAGSNLLQQGQFQAEIDLKIFHNYSIPMKFQGTSSTFQQQKNIKRKGIESTLEDYSRNNNLIEQGNYEVYQKKKCPSYAIASQSLEQQNTLTFSRTLQMYQSSENVDQFEQFINNQKNKNKYDNFIKSQRVLRLKSEQNNQIKEKLNQVLESNKILAKKKQQKSIKNLPVVFLLKQKDYDQLGMRSARTLESPRLKINEFKDQLFVNKQIDKYQPIKTVQVSEFKPDQMQKAKKKFPSQPLSHAELRDCNAELSGHELQKIQAGPTVIKFGQMFIKSSLTQTFWIRNDLQNSIQVQLKIQNQEFEQSYLQPQIIPQGQQAGFDIVFQSQLIQNFSGYLKYVINDKYEFFINVQANVEQVKLTFNKQSIKCIFTEENIEMETSETLRVSNNGNSQAFYKWVKQGDQNLFQISPSDGFVDPYSFKDFTITYLPNQNSNGHIDDEKIILKVKDGQDMVLKVTGQVNEFKSEFTTQQLNLGTISVYKKVEQTIWIKNHNKLTVLHVKDLPPYTEIIPNKGKLLQDESKPFKVIFMCKNEVDINTEICFQPRGAKQIKLPFKVSTKIPNIQVQEELFDFGKLTTLGNPGYLPLTLINQSPMSAVLILDLRENQQEQGPECMDIEYLSSSIPKLTNALQCIDPSQIDQKDDKDKSLNQSHNDSHYEQNYQSKQNRYYKINIPPKSDIKFKLSFVSKEIRQYQFELPLQIYGVGTIQSISRQVKVIGLKPRFILEPQIIEFKRKIITTLDKREPVKQNLVLINPDTQKLKWQIDCSKFFEDKIFKITPNKGVLNSGEQIELTALFNPYKAGIFEQFADLYIDENTSKSQISIKLKGEGIFPRITFDRREIIMPIVPLGVVSKCIFQIFNEGYDNYNIKYNIPQELGPINIKILFIEGKNLSVTITKLRVEIHFQSLKPQSFSTKIEFFDETGRQYLIPVSGTTDNSILTNYSYIQRCPGEFEIKTNDLSPIKITEKQEDMPSKDDSTTKSVQLNLNKNVAQQQISQDHIYNSCKGILNWLNLYCLSQNISQFPQDIVNQNGIQLYEIIAYFLGPYVKFQKKIDLAITNDDDQNKYIQLIQQYEELIYYLKEQGALLNNIRPYYLLKYQDFQNFLKNDTQKDNINFNSLKISEQQYNYQLCDSWINLVYQIIKIFQFSKFNEKSLKQISIVQPDQPLLPDYYLEQSNLFSLQEIILIRWLEIHGLKNSINSRITNLETELRDGLILAQVIKTYVKSSIVDKILILNEKAQTEQECQKNLSKVMQAIQEIGLQIHLGLNDLLNPSQRDMIILISQLYFTLPHYKPKNEIIFFECILGESVTKLIELNNPTYKGVSYYVRYEGSSDFIIEESSFKIEPRQIYKFKVKFVSRISTQQNLRIWFTNRKDGNTQAAAIVFDLQSKITDRKSLQVWNAKSMLYQQEEVKLSITNIFSKSANEFSDFQVTLVQQPKKQLKKKKESQVQTEEQIQQSFFLQKKNIKIRKGETVQFSVFFIPLEKETYHCKIIFCDQTSGEFQHEIFGEVNYPEIFQEIKPLQTIMVDEKVDYEIPFQFKNEQKIMAQKLIDQKMNNRSVHKEQIQDMVYQVSLQPPISFIQFQETFEIKNFDMNKLDSVNFPIQFLFSKPVMNLQTQLIFESMDKKDVRVFKIVLNIHPKIIKAKIEITGSLQEQLLQEIPLINYSDKDWIIRVNISHENQKFQFFSGPKEFFVKRKTTGFYNLNYLPTQICECQSKLIFTNPSTNDIFEYLLIGNVTEPLAQEHFIIKCQVRNQIKKQIPIKNNSNKAITYLVETDLTGAWGQTQFDVLPNQTHNYVLNMNPLFGGVFTGQITFQEKEDPNKFIWFTICLDIEKPKCQKQLEISCIIRKAVAFEINLSNPLNESITYEIFIEGEGLIGDQFIQIEGGKSKNYELIYSPHQIGTFKGCVSIINEKLGEVWYELKLICEKAPIQKLSLFKAELGKFCSKDITLENNSEHIVDVKPIIQNTLNYSIFPNNIKIQPFNSTVIQIRYTPTSMDDLEQSDILLQSDLIGEWAYEVIGKGESPGQFNTTHVRSQIDGVSQFQIKFKNPMNKAISLNLSLKKQQDIFKLVQKNNIIQLDGLEEIMIPIQFNPKEMIPYKNSLILKYEKISWEYPIEGLVDNVENDEIYSFKTKARVMQKQQLKINLPGQQPDKNSHYTLTVDKIPKEYESIVNQAIKITDLRNQIKIQNDPLLFNVQFLPMKQFKIQAQLLLTKNTGGSWRYTLQLESLEPDPDDTIWIFSPLNQTSTVSFKLQNRYSLNSEFKAYLTKESDPQFQVYPKSGVLSDDNQPPFIFYISFTPQEYGKEKIAKIVIETEDMYWNFNVVGSFPKYVPPQIERSVIDNWNYQMQQKQHQKQNFLKENINSVRNIKESLKMIKE